MKIANICLALIFTFGAFATLQNDALGQQFQNLHKTTNVYLYQQEVKGIQQYEKDISLKPSVPVPTFEDEMMVEMVDVYLGGGLSKIASDFNLNDLEVVTVARIASPAELSSMLMTDQVIKRSWVDPRPSPMAVMVGMVLAGHTDTAIHELLPALIDLRDAQILKKIEAEKALLDIREWCWTNLPFPPFPFPGR
ncbi:hypothetical protein OAF83_01550 [Rubripirellula sp.]|nr:hypothetical protein [Rubripirellula sp.]MDB4694947.1 hypothetical protein [bacterium]MDB4749567.1 hypothetical protein [Rubripirellula sp.]